MHILLEIIRVLMPWLGFVVFLLLCLKMIGWVKKRKAGAIAFGLLTQMLLPDPKAQITIEAVVERKQEMKKQQDENGEPLGDDNKVHRGGEQ